MLRFSFTGSATLGLTALLTAAAVTPAEASNAAAISR